MRSRRRPAACPLVTAGFARRLERELTAAQAEIAELRAKCERLEAVVRAEYLFTLGKLSREDEYLLGKDLAELGTTDSAKAAYKSANPGGAHE